jgi:CBS domain-containing protein
MRAVDVMARDVVTVHPDSDIAEAIKLMPEHDVSALPVVDPVSDRVVHLWGLVGSEAARKALLALAEGVPGVSRVADEMILAY